MITKQQLETMKTLQAQMNEKVNADWKTANYPWEDAVLTEAVEAYDHTYWTWWKNVVKTPDVDQIKLELVDIWHFILSDLMCFLEEGENTHFGLVSAAIHFAESQRPTDLEKNVSLIRYALKNVMRAALVDDPVERIGSMVATFVDAMFAVDLGWDELFKLYVGKNCLNQFRQENGYKENTEIYKSTWAIEKNWEDNQYLTQILNNLDINSPSFIADVKKRLQEEFDDNKSLMLHLS